MGYMMTYGYDLAYYIHVMLNALFVLVIDIWYSVAVIGLL